MNLKKISEEALLKYINKKTCVNRDYGRYVSVKVVYVNINVSSMSIQMLMYLSMSMSMSMW